MLALFKRSISFLNYAYVSRCGHKSTESRKEYLISWSWNYRQLWAPSPLPWMLGFELTSSVRAASLCVPTCSTNGLSALQKAVWEQATESANSEGLAYQAAQCHFSTLVFSLSSIETQSYPVAQIDLKPIVILTVSQVCGLLTGVCHDPKLHFY